MVQVGKRIITQVNRQSNEIVQEFKDLPVANIADNLNRFYCIDSKIRPLNSCRILGTAFTVKARTADNLLFHKALDMAEPGDVIVVDAQGDCTNAVAGEIMVRYAMKKGISGFVIDGAVRDLGFIKNTPFPVYACGVSPNGPYKDGPGEINVSISCGGVAINPGDIIVGDEDGVVVIDPSIALELAEKVRKTNDWENQVFKDIEEDNLDRTWIDDKLTELGYDLTQGCKI